MNSKSSYSLSGEKYLINETELSVDFSFDEKNFRISNLSPCTIISTTIDNCKHP